MDLTEYLRVLGTSFFFALATLLPFLNPPAIAPIFLSLTEGASSSTRTVLAKRVAVNVGLMPVSYTHLDVYKRQTSRRRTMASSKLMRA